MNISLRWAMILVTVSLLGTLGWLGGAHRTVAPWLVSLVSAPNSTPDPAGGGARHDNREIAARTLFLLPGDPPSLDTASAPARETTLRDTPTIIPDARLRTADAIQAGPYHLTTPYEIELAGASPADDQAKLRPTKNGFDLVVRNKDVTFVFDLLNQTGQVKIVPMPSIKGPITVTLLDTSVEKALDAILKMRGYLSRKDGEYTLVYTQEDLDELEAMVGRIEIFTYKPKYISATDLSSLLTPHLSEKGRLSNTKANSVGIAASSDNAGGDSLAVEDAIVIQDVPSAVERLKQIIEQVDVRPQQVLIEAVLLSVDLNDDFQMGVNFALLAHANTNLVVSGNGATINGAAGFPPSAMVSGAGKVQGGFATNEHGLKYGVIRGDLTAFVRFLELVGHTTIVASPKVLALNKQRAEIIVGSQLGYRTVTTTETAAVENVQFLDIGTQLRMRPFIQPNGYVRMELHPEKSSGKVSEVTGLPEKDTTQVTTNLTIKSGETIVIGGLIEEQQTRSMQQVPFLGSLPVVGRLFRDESDTITRSELIILITPTIIDDDAEFVQALEEVEQFSRRRDHLERAMPAHMRVSLSRKYLERACTCRDRGDLEGARQMIRLALFFEPTNEAALKMHKTLGMLPIVTQGAVAAPQRSDTTLTLPPVSTATQ